MSSVRRGAILLLFAVAGGGMAAQAHHSISAIYDSGRQVTIDGTVAEFHLVHPHPFLIVDVKEGDKVGEKARQWKGELDNLRELVEIGVTGRTFQPGDRVVIRGSAARAQTPGLYVLRLDRPADGFWYEQVGQSPRIRKP